MEKKTLISIVIAIIFLSSSIVGLLEIFFFSPPQVTTTIQNFIISNATTFADVSFTGNFLINKVNSSLLGVLKSLQQNGSVEFFNVIGNQVVGKAKDARALRNTNASVEVVLSFSEPVEFYWLGNNFFVDPSNFKETTTYVPISSIDFSKQPPRIKVLILAQISKNLSVISYQVSPFQT